MKVFRRDDPKLATDPRLEAIARVEHVHTIAELEQLMTWPDSFYNGWWFYHLQKSQVEIVRSYASERAGDVIEWTDLVLSVIRRAVGLLNVAQLPITTHSTAPR